MTGNAAVHARVARVLDGRATAGDAMLPDDLELFRGFLTKVRHNALRAEMPRTLRALQQCGLEVAFFRGYAPEFAALRRAGASREARITALHDALARFACQHERARHARDVARHELLLACAAPERSVGGGRRLLLAAAVERYEFDPRFDEPVSGPCFLAYPGAVELTVGGALLLSLLDGTATLAQAVRDAAARTGAEAETIRAFYRDAVAAGLVVLA